MQPWGPLTLEPLTLIAADSNVQFDRKEEVESLPSSWTKTKRRLKVFKYLKFPFRILNRLKIT